MKLDEAKAWLKGERSMTNLIPEDPFETWQVRVAQADAAMIQQAYWVVRAHREFGFDIRPWMDDGESPWLDSRTHRWGRRAYIF